VSCPSCPCSASLSPRPSPFHPPTSYSAILRPDGLPTRQRRRPRPCHRLRIRPDVKPREPLRRDSALPVASHITSWLHALQHLAQQPTAGPGWTKLAIVAKPPSKLQAKHGLCSL
jgi:hypothetical protein